MRTKKGQLVVFSISALDLFASSLGAFILIVIILFPYYQKTGNEAGGLDFSETMKQRSRNLEEALSQEVSNRQLKDELKAMEGEMGNLTSEIQSLKDKLFGKKRAAEALASKAAKLTSDVKEKDKKQSPRLIKDGIEFSILGVETNAKSFVILVDLSGSMDMYVDILIASLEEILDVMKPTSQFAIIGFSDAGAGRLIRYPGGKRMQLATPANLFSAKRFARTLPAKLGGTTPTALALMAALDYKAEAIILLSDGAPDDMSGPDIVVDITARNRRKGFEIHTVAIGDYANQPSLTKFLQELAERNRGYFVGVSK